MLLEDLYSMDRKFAEHYNVCNKFHFLCLFLSLFHVVFLLMDYLRLACMISKHHYMQRFWSRYWGFLLSLSRI